MRKAKEWRQVHQDILERVHRETPGKVLFRLAIKLYPTELRMEDENDKCSDCRAVWCHMDGAMAHAHGLPHFRQWCIEHPGQVRERFPEAIELTAEATLAEVQS